MGQSRSLPRLPPQYTEILHRRRTREESPPSARSLCKLQRSLAASARFVHLSASHACGRREGARRRRPSCFLLACRYLRFVGPPKRSVVGVLSRGILLSIDLWPRFEQLLEVLDSRTKPSATYRLRCSFRSRLGRWLFSERASCRRPAPPSYHRVSRRSASLPQGMFHQGRERKRLQNPRPEPQPRKPGQTKQTRTAPNAHLTPPLRPLPNLANASRLHLLNHQRRSRPLLPSRNRPSQRSTKPPRNLAP